MSFATDRSPWRHLARLLLLGAVSACGPAAHAQEPEVPQQQQRLPDDPKPSPEDEDAMFATTYGDPETLEAVYEADPIAGGKRFQGAWLVKPDGSRFLVSYRAEPERFEFIDKRVVVVGRRVHHGPAVQQIMADHFTIDTIALADGETPYAAPPTQLPAPPTVTDESGLRAREGRWCRLVGTIVSVTDAASSPDRVILELASGTRVAYEAWDRSRWAPLLNKKATVVTTVARADSQTPPPLGDAVPEQAAPWLMVGPAEVCEGDVARCGME